MNNKKVLAVALSAGLVLGGAYALDTDNVAYASEVEDTSDLDAYKEMVLEEFGKEADSPKKSEYMSKIAAATSKDEIDILLEEYYNPPSGDGNEEKEPAPTEDPENNPNDQSELEEAISGFIGFVNSNEDYKDVPQKFKDEQFSKLYNANTLTELDNIINNDIIPALNNYKPEDPLAENRKSAVEKIDALKNLDEDTKEKYKAQLAEAEDAGTIEGVVAQANAADEAAAAEDSLAENRKSAVGKIDALKNLDEDTKEEYKAQLAEVKDVGKIEEIIAEANAADKAAEPKEDPLAKNRESAVEKIDALENLDEDTKEEFKAQIAEAESLDTIEGVVAKANAADEAAAAKEDKEQAKSIVDSNQEAGNITEEQAKEFKKRIDEAGTKDQINKILSEVAQVYRDDQAAEREALENVKTQAKSIVDSNQEVGNITEEQAKEFKNRIDEAGSKDQINKILSEVAQVYRDAQKNGTEETEKPGKLVTIDEYLTKVGMETEELARKQAEDDLKSKGLEGLYDIEVRQGYSDGEYGRWFYRFVPKEDDVVEVPTPLTPLVPADEIFPAPEQTPDPDHDIVPPIPDFSTDDDSIIVPGPIVDPIDDEDKPVVTDNDDEQKAKDLTDKLNEISKEIKDTLVENEKEIAKEDKEEVKPSDDNKEEGSKEEGSKEEKEEKEEKEDKDDKNDDKKADAKKEAIKVEKVVKHSNPKTGVESIVPVVSTLAISMAGIVATRKKNN